MSQPGLTNDHLAYHDNAIASTYQLYVEKKTGLLSTFPFGIFGYARLDERLADSDLWKSAPRTEGRDPMGLSSNQPNIEFWNSELYGGPKQFTDFPIDNKHAFAMCTMLFNQRSRGSVTLKSSDSKDNPVVDHAYLEDPLDMLVLSEACRFMNEIVLEGSGTKNIVKGTWPEGLGYDKWSKRENWEEYVRDNATTCKLFFLAFCNWFKPHDSVQTGDKRLHSPLLNI